MNVPFPPRNTPPRAKLLLLLPLLLPLLLALLAGLSPPVAAGGLRPSPRLVDMEIIDRDTGQALPQYRHARQTWLPGEPGHRYAVRLRNRSGARVLVVLSVDGINAVDGRTADPHQAGYVLGPWQTLEVAGWRKSLDAIAQFEFVDPAWSYAARTGRPGNLGVIGVAVFRERTPYPSPAAAIANARRTVDRAGAASEADAAPPAMPASDVARKESRPVSRYGDPSVQSSLGTGHGAIEGSQAYYTAFERQSAPSQVTELRYDTRAGLLARGVRMGPPHHRPPYAGYDRPRAFPDFVADP